MTLLKTCDIVSVRKLEGTGNLKAFVDIRIGGSLIIKGCAIMDGKNGIFASLPRKLGRDGQWTDVVLVSDEELKQHYEKEILKAYEEVAS